MKLSKLVTLFTVVFALCVLGGCRRPYEVPEYKEVGPSETAFVIPLEGDVSNQAKFDSAEQVAKYKVAAKRIQITHRWNQTGRWDCEGAWIASVLVITIDRSPVTSQWTTSVNNGTANKDEGIWAESRDSVGFSTGFSVSAMIQEDTAALFLYRYSGKQLQYIMDNEIRARVQMVFADFAAQYDMSELREKKQEILAAIRKDAIEFFEGRGITITTIGNFGGFTYENQKIQDSIDNVFIAQRLKEVAKAQLDAQTDVNKRLQMEGQGEAQKLAAVAQGRADAARTEAGGEATRIETVLKAIQAAASNPLYLQLRILEVQQAQIQKWDGKFPVYFMGTGATPNMLLNLPAPSMGVPAAGSSK